MCALAVICLGGLIFAGIRMMTDRFQYIAIDQIHESSGQVVNCLGDHFR